MKPYRMGLEYQNILERLEFTRQEFADEPFDGCTAIKAEARIVNCSLHMRRVSQIFQEKGMMINNDLGDMCPHQQTTIFDAFSASCWEIDGSLTPIEIIRCLLCPTEFILEITEYWGTNKAIATLTTWMELCEGLTPLDPIFYNHLKDMMPFPRYHASDPTTGVAGCIRLAFDEGSVSRGSE